MGGNRRIYDKEFKRDAVKLVLEGGRSKESVSRDLGIAKSTLVYWICKYQEDPENCFPGKGYLKPQDEEIRRLKKELADVKEERDILKKTTAIFSRGGR